MKNTDCYSTNRDDKRNLAAQRVTEVLEEHLAVLPEEEQEIRVAAFERAVVKASREKRIKRDI